MCTFLESQVREVLGLDREDHLDRGQTLADLGVDSLMAVDLVNALSHTMGISVAPTLVFNYPTINAIADYLLGEVPLLNREEKRGEEEILTKTPTVMEQSDSDEIQQLSEEEALAQLAAELDGLDGSEDN